MKRGLTDIVNAMRGSTQIAKIMRGTTLIWQFAVAVVDYFTGYKARVEADYGYLEDETQLQVEVVAGTEYDNAIAIYNPNGGHRAGKIYDVRDTDNTSPYDLTVTGGGGTRINVAGLVDELSLYNFLPYSNDVNQWVKTNCIASQNGHESTVTDNTAAGIHKVYKQISGNYLTTRTHSVEIKKTNQRYVTVGIGLALYYVIYDFDTNSVTYYSWAGLNASTVDVEVKVDGWIRISMYFDNPSNNLLFISVGLAFDSVTESYTGVGDKSVMFRAPMAANSPSFSLTKLDYQVNTGTAAFPKIDYGTGQAAFLIEPTRTNKFPYNNDFSRIDWETAGVKTPNFAIAPDGTMTALRYEDSTSYFGDYMNNGPTGDATISCWVKSNGAGKDKFRLHVHGSGTVSSEDFTATSEWVKYSHSTSNAGGAGTSRLLLSSTGDPQDLLLWGFQLEEGLIATSYIPTKGAAVTRTSSYIKIPITLTDFEMEFDIEIKQFGDARLVLSSTGSMALYIQTNGSIRLVDGAGVNTGTLASVVLNQRCTLKFIKQDGVFTTLLDGVQKSSFSASGSFINPFIGKPYFSTDNHFSLYSLKIK